MNDNRLRHIILFLLMAVPVTPIRAGILTDYLLGGALTLKNGRIDKYYFEGGFARAFETSATTDRFVFYYYNQDHLGNNREVVDIKGRIHQVTNYYPFGAPYADENAIKGKSLQPYKYNGKELDLMHGLNTYDYGARQYDPILARWDRVDRMAEKKPWQSPYVYGRNNPIRFVDPDGNDELDKAMGYLIGAATNIMPISGARDWYSPADASDYNTALQTTDNTFMAMGGSMVNAGKGGAALGTGIAATGGAVIVGSGGTAAIAGASTAVAGAALTGVSASAGAVGTLMQMNAANNRNGGYNRGKNTDSSKNERHGDAGRGQTKADKRLSDLQNRLSNATSKKEKMEIKRTMRHIKEDAERKRHGEEHSRGNKR